MKKYLRWALAFCGILVLMLGLLSGCGEKEAATMEGQGLYWNVEGNNYLGNPGEVPVRRMESDGYFYVKFAHGGKQERYRVTEEVIKKGLDLYKISVLIFDEEGTVVDFKTVEEATGGYFVKECFVETVEGNTITCNSAPTYEGFRQTFEYPETMKIYLVGGDGPLVGMETTIKPDDEITIICDKEGNLTDCFVAPLEETPTVYFSKTRMYNSTTKMTTRESNLAGIYSFDMAVNGEPVTVRAKTQEMASKMDSFAARNMILTFDEDGYVESAVSGDSVCGVWASWFNVLKVENGQLYTVRSRQATNLGTTDFAQLARNFVAYDVTTHIDDASYGQITELKKGDTIHCLKNSRGQIAIAFVVNRKQDAEIYWNVTRMYSSATKETTRVPDEEGWYEIVLTKDGQQYTLKCQDRELISYIDRQAAKHCGVKVENGIIVGVCSAEDTTGGGAFASWYDITDISTNGKKLGILRNVDSNIGTYVTGTMADDCKIYDVSGMGSFVGEITEVRIDDRVHCVLNDEGKIGIIFVVRRLCEPTMYWNVEQKYNDTTKSTTRAKYADGYYRVTLAVNGKHVTYKVADKAVMNSIDKRPYLRSFGADIENGVITRVHEPALVTGGGGFASWADITSIKDGVITAVKTTKSDAQTIGTVYTAKMAEDCQVYDVTELAKLDSYIGVKTKPRVGDRIYGHLNLQGEIEVLYIVGNRLVNGYLAWNFARKYDSTNKVSTRVPDEDGWYKVDLAVNGKHVVWKTKDKEIIDKVDSAYWSGLTVNKEGVIQKHYSYNLIYGGYSQASWYDVTRISGSYVTAKKTISASDQGKVVTFKRASNCKVYDVSENYVDHKGEETTLQVGDRIHVINASNNIDARVIYIVWRPDRAGEPDHFHCQCVDGSANGLGDHVCEESFGWSAWTNPRKLPTSGNWYLDTDVTLTAGYSVAATATLNLCLNGHTVNGPETTRVYYNSGNLTITDCTDAGQIIANANANGSIFYGGPTTEGSVTNIYGGTFKNSLEQMSKSGAIAFVGDKTGIANVNIYGGTFEGVKNTYPGANFYVMGDSYVNIYGGKLIGGETPSDGANIYVNAGQINVCGGELIAGTTTKQGGNIYMSTGTLKVSGGSLTGGTVALVKAHAEVTGGTIQGGLDIQGQTTIDLSGNPVISGGTEFNLRLSSSENVTLGDFTDGAEIYVRSTVLNVPFGKLEDPTDKAFFFSDDPDATMGFTAENEIYLKANHTHCVCGTGAFEGVGDHVCDDNAGWVKWTDATRLPTSSGYYYLDTDVTTTAVSSNYGGEVYLCLNGHTVNGPTTARTYYTNGKLTITDCKPVGEQGQIIANSGTPGDVVYVGPTAAGGELNIFGGTFKTTIASGTKPGMIFFVGDSLEGVARMNMYGGTVIGTTTTSSGGAMYIMWDAHVNLYGGTISGGKGASGGNIYMLSGELNLCGTTITGGVATSNGGNVYVADGKLGISDGAVSNGTIVVAKGEVAVTGGTVSGGLDILAAATAQISGKAVIAGNTGFNLRVASAENVTLGSFESGANVYVSATAMNVPVATLAGSADLAYLTGDSDNIIEANAENQIYLKASHVHCECGTGAFAGVGSHTCDETIGWVKWTDSTKLPTTSGYYYLGTDVTMTGGASLGNTADVHLCLNGHTVNGSTTARVYYTTGKLTITDCKPVAQQGQIIANANQPGGVVYSGPSAAGSLLTIYGGTFKTSLTQMSKVGGIIFVGDSKDGISDMDMYGGTVLGANNTSNGGAFYIMGTSTINLYGGTIQGGKTPGQGGNINMIDGQLNLRGTTITGGEAAQGGNINMTKGQLNIYAGTVSDGTIAVSGGATVVTGGTVSGGLQVLNAATLTLADKAVITGLSISDGTKVTIGDMTEGAAVTMVLTKAEDLVGPLADPADKIYFSSAKTGTELLLNEDNMFYMLQAVHKHCVCGGAPVAAAAAHTCEQVVWSPISEALQAVGLTATTADFGKLPAGNYYLDTDLVVTGSTRVENKQLQICLNGHNVTTTGGLVFAYGINNGVLTLTDCSYNAENGTWKGTMKGGTYQYGGIMYTGGKLVVNIYGGNYTRKNADTVAKSGGLISMAQEYLDTTKADPAFKSTLNIYNGNIYGGSATNNGGNIALYQCSDMNMYGGTISDGSAGSGGNLYASTTGTIRISGGTISGGTLVVAKGQAVVTGGTVSGSIYMQTAATLSLSGNPVISVLSIVDGTKVTIGDMTTGAKVALSFSKADDLVGPLADPADKEFFTSATPGTQLLMNGENKLYVAQEGHRHCVCGGAPVSAAASHTCSELVWTPISKALEAVSLTATTADFGKLPAGNYYLDADITVTGQTRVENKQMQICLNGHNVTTTGGLVFGYGINNGVLTLTDCSYDADSNTWQGTMKGGTYQYGGIMYTGGKMVVNIYGGNYTRKNADTKATIGGLISMGQDVLDTTKADPAFKSTLNIYNGHIYGGYATKNGGNIALFQCSDMNMYGGTLSDGTAGSGGLIHASTSGTVNIYGGTLKNGIASSITPYTGGAITVYGSGKLNVYGGSFVGNAAYRGGAIYASGATTFPTVSIEGGKFYTAASYTNTTANRAYEAGGNICMDGGTLYIKSGADIGYGYTTNLTSSFGGNIYAKNAYVTVSGGTIVGGKSLHGGNIYYDGNTDNSYVLTLSGGVVSGGQAIHTGYPTAKNAENQLLYPAGGNISVNANEKVLVNGATIQNGVASHCGGNISVNGTADLEVRSGSILGGTAAYSGNIHTNNSADVIITISGGTITGGTLDTSKVSGTGACLRLHSTVKLILSGTPEIESIFFVGNNLLDAKNLGTLETPIAIQGKTTSVAFAEVTADLSSAFTATNGSIRYVAGEGKLYIDIG